MRFNLLRQTKFEVKFGIISQFQLNIEYRQYKIKTVVSKDNKELKFQYTNLSGYIMICEDVEEIMAVLE